jgi:hypothetical protein
MKNELKSICEQFLAAANAELPAARHAASCRRDVEFPTAESRIRFRHKLKAPASVALTAAAVLAAASAPECARACACGCGIFEVGTSSMFPEGQGAMAFLDYDYQDQNQNWDGNSPSDNANNGDKEIRTHFVDIGLQYMFSSSWGVQLELPYDFRYFRGTAGDGTIASHSWSQLGDIRINGIFTGFSPDLSAGITFGLKVPTGDHSVDPDLVDRDTQIGTGSTDILLGGFYRHTFAGDRSFHWYGQTLLDVPTLIQDQYRPGVELDAAAGLYYTGWTVGNVTVVPVAQVLGSWRAHDSGLAANPANSGYERVLLSPGMEFDFRSVRLYADVELPIFQDFNGNQIAAPALFKLSLSYMF